MIDELEQVITSFLQYSHLALIMWILYKQTSVYISLSGDLLSHGVHVITTNHFKNTPIQVYGEFYHQKMKTTEENFW